MSSNTKTVLAVTFGLSLFAATGYFLYMLLKKDEEDYYDNVSTSNAHTKLEIKIPKENVRNVIGRSGANIKDIESRTQTKINFKDSQRNESARVCVIRGAKQNCLDAENLIYEMIANQPVIENKEVWVPKLAVGRIIGRNGERIHHITEASGAKVIITHSTENCPTDEKRIILKGTNEEIGVAMSLILDIVNEEMDFRKRIEDKLALREPRGKPRNKIDKGLEVKKSYENLAHAAGGDGQMEVYVSAVVDPSQFWLQIVGPNANELDQLVEEMTEYYSKPDNRELHIIPEPSVGEIVAAVFDFDTKWYRAEIMSISLNEEDDTRYAVLYYVDYGDTEKLPVTNVYELRTDFLRLRFQAIECYLARVEAKDGNWTEKSVDYFEEWTHVAQWKKLRAHVNGYKERSKLNSNQVIRREGSPIPGVDLYDMSQHDDVDIAVRLVNHDFAKFTGDATETLPKRRLSLVSNSEHVNNDSITNGNVTDTDSISELQTDNAHKQESNGNVDLID